MVSDIYRAAVLQAGSISPFALRPIAAGVEYRGLSDAHALGLAVAQDPQLFALQPTKVLDPPAGATIKRYLDDFAARIDVPGQDGDVIAQSLTPIRVQRAGQQVPVDLKLVDSGAGFVAQAPVAPVAFSHRLVDGLTVAQGIGLRVVGASAAANAEVRGQQVFYANALQDTDVFATPLPAGSETFVQLRSYASPRSIALQFDLPEGARLVADPAPNTGATIVRGADVLAAIDPPTSIDANGVPVPTTLRVDGTRLVIDVAVTRTTALPVLVDPIVTDNQFAGADAASIDGSFNTARGWRRQTSGPLGNFSFTPNADDNAAGGTCARTRGGNLTTLAGQLCVSSQSATAYAAGGEVGEWAFRPPSGLRSYTTDGANVPTDAYIYRADVRMNFAKLSSPATAFMYAGMRSGRDPSTYIGSSTNINADGSGNDLRNGLFTSGYGAPGVVYNDSFFRIFCIRSDCGGDLNADNSKDGAFFTAGAWVAGSGNSIVVSAQGAIFYENDRTNPTVTTHTTSTDLSGWKRTGTVTTLVAGHDAGMGTKTVGETYTNRAGALATVPYSSGCNGTSAAPCNADLAQTLTTNIDDMPEGADPLVGYATDILGKNALGNALTVKVDRTPPPAPTVSGLSDGGYVGTTAPALSISTSDPPANGATASSGPASAAITIDGGTPSTIACTSSCGWQLPSDLAEGAHSISIQVTDGAGNVGPARRLGFVVDRTPPGLSVAGELYVAEQTGSSVGWENPVVGFDSLDDPTDQTSSIATAGVASVELTIDGTDPDPGHYRISQTCGVSGCDLDGNIPATTIGLAAGSHAFRVTATDNAGNSTTSTIRITVDPTKVTPADPQPQRAASTPTTSLTALQLLSTSLLNLFAPSVLHESTTAQTTGGSIAPALGTLTDLNGYLPYNSQTPIHVGSSPADGVALETPDGSISLKPTGLTDVAPAVVNGTALDFAGVATDADLLIRPTGLGVDSLVQLRTPLAPTSYSWTVSMDGGQILQQLPNGSIAILADPTPVADAPIAEQAEPAAESGLPGDPITAPAVAAPRVTPYNSSRTPIADPNAAALKAAVDDTAATMQTDQAALDYATTNATAGTTDLQAVIAAPWAVDATGRPVPAALSVHDNVVTLTIETATGGPYTYPIVADPRAAAMGGGGCDPNQACPPGPNIAAMRRYAYKWRTGRNSAYQRFGADCTNFVSQILHAGGVPFKYLHSPENQPSGWWTDHPVWYRIGPDPHTLTWSVAQDFLHWALHYRYATRVRTNTWKVGDVLLWAYSNSTGDGAEHTNFVYDLDGQGQPILVQHAADYDPPKPLSEFLARADAQYGGVKRFWHLRFTAH